MKPQFRRTALSLAITGLLVTGTAMAQTDLVDVTEETVSITPGHTISPTEERMMARAASHVLRNIAEARSAINEKDVIVAKTHLDWALTLIDKLKLEQPTSVVRDHIWIAGQHLDYDSTEEVASDLVPIEASLTEIETFVPVEKARKHIHAAHGHMKKGNKAGAKKELKAANAALIYTEVDLPLSATERQVIAAQKALKNNQLKQADKALKLAEDNVLILSSTVASPITQARNSLWQASKDYTNKHYKMAKAHLAEASAWLHKAALSTDETTHKEATKLKHWAESLKDKVSTAGKDTAKDLTSLWHHSKALAERESEKASAAWGKLGTESHAKTELIDAKLHLTYAQSAQFVQGKSAEIGDELDKAQGYLDKAYKISDKALKAKIRSMGDDLKQLKANLDDKGEKAHANYEKVKADLRQAIRDL